MDADQSFEEEDDDNDEEEENVTASKKRPASSPALKSQVCFTSGALLLLHLSKLKWC